MGELYYTTTTWLPGRHRPPPRGALMRSPTRTARYTYMYVARSINASHIWHVLIGQTFLEPYTFWWPEHSTLQTTNEHSVLCVDLDATPSNFTFVPPSSTTIRVKKDAPWYRNLCEHGVLLMKRTWGSFLQSWKPPFSQSIVTAVPLACLTLR